MATASERFDISVNIAGAEQAAQQISAVGDAAKKTASDLDKFHDAMGTAGARGLATSAKETSVSVGGMARDFALMERAGASGMRNLVGGFGLVATSAAAAGIAVGGLVQAGRKAVELGRLGGESLTVKASFDQMTASVGVSTNELQEMQQAADGTIATLKLLELANYSMIGVTGDVGRAIGNANDQLIEIARAAFKARPSLQSVEFAYQSLVDGIKRVEKRLVDNLGLQVKAREANEKYAAAVGKSVDELTSEEVQLAFLNEVLRAGGILIQQVGGDVETMNDAFSRAEAAAMNLKVAMGEKLAPAVTKATDAWANFLTVLTAGITNSPQDELAVLRNTLEMQREQLAKLQEQANSDDFLGALSAWIKFSGAIALQEQAIADTEAEIRKYEDAARAAEMANANAARVAREYADDTSLLDARVQELTASFLAFIDAVRGFAAAEGAVLDKVQETFDKSLGSTVRSLASMGASFGDATAEGRKLATQIAQLEWLNQKGLVSTELYNYQMGVLDSKLQDLKDGYKETTSRAKEFHDEFREGLASMVASQLSASFTVDELAPELSVREDEVDEHYRRLAAIAIRGQEELDKHQTDWADTLAEIPEDVKAKGIEAIQAWARDKVMAYDKGLDFSLINRDTLKKRIMEALLAQEMKEQLVAEITAELGGAVSEAQVAAAASSVLGGTPLSQISLGGVTFGPSETPPDMSAVAGQISTQLNLAFKDKIDAFEMIQMTAQAITAADKKPIEAAAQDVGKTMIGGISDAVATAAPDIVFKLANALAPSVARIIADQNRRTGQMQ